MHYLSRLKLFLKALLAGTAYALQTCTCSMVHTWHICLPALVDTASPSLNHVVVCTGSAAEPMLVALFQPEPALFYVQARLDPAKTFLSSALSRLMQWFLKKGCLVVVGSSLLLARYVRL